MKQTAIYAALQFIMAQTGYRDTQLPIDGDTWSQSDQAAWQGLAVDKLNVPPHVAHEVPTSLEVLSTYKSIIPEWLDLVKAAGEHAALIEGETYEPPAPAPVGEGDETDDSVSQGEQDAGAPADESQETVAAVDTVAEDLTSATPEEAVVEEGLVDTPADEAVVDEPTDEAVVEDQADNQADEAEGV